MRPCRAAWLLLLLALGLPGRPWGCRCPREPPPGPPLGRNESLAPGAPRGGRPRTADLAVLVAVGGWAAAVLAYVGRYVRRSRAEARLHLQYLKSLPCERPSPEEEEDGEEEQLRAVL